MENSLPPLIVIVHSADSLQNRGGNGAVLRYPFSSGGDLFLFLKKLTNNFPTFRFLLTVDRIDWFNSRCIDFHFVHLCINTFQPFIYEKHYTSTISKEDVDFYEIATRSVAILQNNEKKVLEILLDTILFQHQRAQQLAELEKRTTYLQSFSFLLYINIFLINSMHKYSSQPVFLQRLIFFHLIFCFDQLT